VNPRWSLLVALAAGIVVGLGSVRGAEASGPNIILILADDFGWGDASCNNPDSPLKTPAIDRIANEGSVLRLPRRRPFRGANPMDGDLRAHTPSGLPGPGEVEARLDGSE